MLNDNSMARPDYTHETPVGHYPGSVSQAPPFISAGRNYGRGKPVGAGVFNGHDTGGALMTAVILFVVTAGIVLSVAFLLYLWERYRTRHHGQHRVPRTIKPRNVTSKRIAS